MMLSAFFRIRPAVAIISIIAGVFWTTNAQTRLYVDPGQSWSGFMNVFNLPVNGGTLQFGGVWAGSDLRATFGGGLLTLRPCTNVSNPTDLFWVKPDGSGNKQMEANWFVNADGLVGTNITFSGNSVDHTLPAGYSCHAFIKVFNADYSGVLQSATAPITAGNQFFTASLNATNVGAAHVQYGFATTGPNAAIGSAASKAFVTIRTNAADNANLLANPGFEQGIAGWIYYGNGGFTETAGNTYFNGGVTAGASNVLVWEGVQVQKVFPTFSGSENYSGIIQVFPTGPNSVWSASAKFLTHQQDQIGGLNQCWLEVTFRNSQNNVLATYKSQTITHSSPTNTWLDMTVTNAAGGSTLTAPEGTVVMYFQEVYYQPSDFAGGSVFADAMTLHNLTPSDPFISALPTNVTRVVGQTATFTVGATGKSTLTYQWKKEGVPLANDSRISGAQSSILTLANVQKTDIGTYSVTVSDLAGSMEASASLNVKSSREAANLLENSSLEADDFAPWIKFNGSALLRGPDVRLSAQDGLNFGELFSDGTFNGVYQDLPALPGEVFSAQAWFKHPSDLPLMNATAWLELQFRNAVGPVAIYQSSVIDSNTPKDAWFKLRATNGFAGDFVTPIGNAEYPPAPTGATSLRFQIVLRSDSGAGSVFYDTMELLRNPPATLSASLSAANITIAFNTLPGTNYEVVYKNKLDDASWTPIAGTINGDGSVKTVSYPPLETLRFYTVRTK